MHVKRLGLISLWLSLFLMACDSVELEPAILTFEAEPASIEAGETSTLSWTIVGVSDAEGVTLTPGDVTLSPTDTYQVSPSETTEYTLSAGPEGSEITKSLTLTVEDAPPDPAEPINPEPITPGPEPTEPVEASCEAPDERVDFNDAELERQVRENLVEQDLEMSAEGVTCDQMASLETLYLGYDPQNGAPNPNPAITDLSGLENAINLSYLGMVDFVAPLDPVASLENLKQLEMGSNSDSLAPLAQLKSLESIRFFNLYLPDDLSPLTEIDTLTTFAASGVDYAWEDITSIANIPNLATLNIEGFEVPTADPIDISPLANATKLKTLTFKNVTFFPDLNALSELTQLSTLSLTFSGDIPSGEEGINTLSSLEFIAPLVNLEVLNLRTVSREISDISPLANLTKLRELTLTDGQVDDISVLLTLPWAAEDDSANLFGNPVPAEQIEALKEKVAIVEF